ncbi:hypothetical protein EVAR_68139_1 [Eumeta japonica]|uniref:Uncharacterized protein n=1 Tax=Eumeta variegata TaxID=151549 RepID=A0A4C2A383_EUMVA|nr:hypothetical protein EVAR_68139_1 [Eumeta japonica]
MHTDCADPMPLSIPVISAAKREQAGRRAHGAARRSSYSAKGIEELAAQLLTINTGQLVYRAKEITLYEAEISRWSLSKGLNKVKLYEETKTAHDMSDSDVESVADPFRARTSLVRTPPRQMEVKTVEGTH